MRRWHQHFIANGLFHHGDTDIHTFPRAYDLYLSNKPNLRDCPSYVDLPAAVREATALEPDTLWFILFALMAHWRTLEPPALAEGGTWVMDPHRYFSSLNFSAREIDRFLGLVAVDAETMRKQIHGHYALDALRQFHVLPFAKWPLVIINKKVFCVSVGLLKDKLTSGLHHLFLDERSFASERRQRYLDYMGTVYEDYVSRLLARVYPATANRYVGPGEIAESIEGRSCDFVIHYGDALVLLEAKATRFGQGARTEESWPEYERQFKEIFLDSASQIDNTIRGIEGGRLRHLGIDPANIRAYFPLVVALEDLPMTHLIYTKIREDIERERWLQHPKVKPLQAIDIGDLEFLEIALHSGRSLRDILQDKVASEEDRDQSMGNYLLARDEPFMKGPVNPYLEELFTRLGDQAIGLFRARQVAEP